VKLYVLDANAVMRFLQKAPGFEKVSDLFRKQAASEVKLLISVVNRGEVLYGLARRVGIEQARSAMAILAGFVEAVEIRQEDADAAAILKWRYKLGFADCFAAELAIREEATLVTADPDFAKLGKQLKILALPRHQG
jgi:predicted nucleic acid-binding protein